MRWNPDPEDVQRSVIKLVLSLIEFIRKLMERQAIRRLEEKTLTPEEIENVGIALMKLEQTVYQLAKRFKLDPKDLNLDLGPLGKLHYFQSVRPAPIQRSDLRRARLPAFAKGCAGQVAGPWGTHIAV